MVKYGDGDNGIIECRWKLYCSHIGDGTGDVLQVVFLGIVFQFLNALTRYIDGMDVIAIPG